jgi:hypothetical protein
MVVEVRDFPAQEEYQIPVLSLVKDLDMTVNNREYVEEAVRRMFYPLTVRDDVWIRYLPVFKDGKLNIETGMVHFSPAEELLPHILNLAGNFTAYNLSTILGLRSGYAIKLYELFLSDSYKDQPVVYKVDELREILGIGKRKFSEYGMFKIKVIETAQKALKNSDINFDFEELKSGKKITALAVTIKKIKEIEKVEKLRNTAPRVDEIADVNDSVSAMERVLGIGVKQALRNWEHAVNLAEGNENLASERIFRNLKHTETSDMNGKIKTGRPNFFYTSLTEDWAQTIINQNNGKEALLQAEKARREAQESRERQKEEERAALLQKQASDRAHWLSEFEMLPRETLKFLRDRQIQDEIAKGVTPERAHDCTILSYQVYKIAKETGSVIFDEKGYVVAEQSKLEI